MGRVRLRLRCVVGVGGVWYHRWLQVMLQAWHAALCSSRHAAPVVAAQHAFSGLTDARQGHSSASLRSCVRGTGTSQTTAQSRLQAGIAIGPVHPRHTRRQHVW